VRGLSNLRSASVRNSRQRTRMAVGVVKVLQKSITNLLQDTMHVMLKDDNDDDVANFGSLPITTRHRRVLCITLQLNTSPASTPRSCSDGQL